MTSVKVKTLIRIEAEGAKSGFYRHVVSNLPILRRERQLNRVQRGVNVGYVSAGSQSFAHNCAMSQPISADVYNNSCELLTGYSGITNLTVSTTHVHMTGSNPFGDITFHLKYTK